MVSCEALKALPVAYQKDGKASPAGAGWEDAAQYLGDLIKFTASTLWWTNIAIENGHE